MANKQIKDYIGQATVARDDLVLSQTSDLTKYNAPTHAEVLALLAAADIPDLDASKITTGTLAAARLPAVSSSSSGVVPETSGASAGDVASVKSDGSIEYVTPSSSSGGSPTNLLINGSFPIWQRGDTLTSVSEFDYTSDRWYALYESAAINVTRATGDEQRYAAKITQPSATAQRAGIVQIIEGVNCFHTRGGKLTLSGRVKLSTADNVRFAVLAWSGTEDGDVTTTPNPHFSNTAKDVVNNWSSSNYTTGNFFTSSNLSVVLCDNVTCDGSNWSSFEGTSGGNVPAGMNNLIVLVWSESTMAQNVTLELEALQIETGDSANDFQQRSVGEELALCQRYYQQITGNGGVPVRGFIFGGGTNFFDGLYAFITELRVVPADVSFTGTWDTSLGTMPAGKVGGINYNITASVTTTGTVSVSITNKTRVNCGVRYTTSTSFSGTAGDNVGAQIGSGVNIPFDAEL